MSPDDNVGRVIRPTTDRVVMYHVGRGVGFDRRDGSLWWLVNIMSVDRRIDTQ